MTCSMLPAIWRIIVLGIFGIGNFGVGVKENKGKAQVNSPG